MRDAHGRCARMLRSGGDGGPLRAVVQQLRHREAGKKASGVPDHEIRDVMLLGDHPPDSGHHRGAEHRGAREVTAFRTAIPKPYVQDTLNGYGDCMKGESRREPSVFRAEGRTATRARMHPLTIELSHHRASAPSSKASLGKLWAARARNS